MEKLGPDQDRHVGDGELDERIRHALEPRAAAVERVVQRSLREESVAPRMLWSRKSWWPALATAAALVVLMVVLWPTSDANAPALGPELPPARISISNADGYVTISSAAGSKWILVPGDES